MRARRMLYAVIGLSILAGAAQGQVDAPAGETKVAGGVSSGSDSLDTSGKEIRIDKTQIPFKVHYEFSRTVSPGRLLTVKKGEPGRIEKVYEIHRKDGKPVGKTLLKTRRVEPTHQLVYMGRSGYTTSRHKFTRSKVITMHASAYDPSAGRGRNATFRTATGLRAQYGVVAVDPRVIPLGTKLFIEGYGFALAADTGGAIKGNKIDLCYNTRSQCMKFGRRKVVVHILK